MLDVLIAGAGPAGSVAAAILAGAGARVAIVDRARFPRAKLCGDTLNPGAAAILRRLGVEPRIAPRALRLEGMIVTGEGAVAVRGEWIRRGRRCAGWALTRRELDVLLLERALEAGAQVDEGVLVQGPLADQERGLTRVGGLIVSGRAGRSLPLRARVTIAADGRASRVASTLRLIRHPRRPRRWVVGAYFEGVAGLSSFGEMHIRRDRYLGVAPLPGGLANVCYVAPGGPRFADPTAALMDAVAADAALADRFSRARLIGAPVSMGPLAVDAAAAGVGGLLLAGDAAGFVDPMTGDGLRLALRGAELAAETALEMLTTGRDDGHRALARRRARAFGGKLRLNRALRALVAAPAGVLAGTGLAALAPQVLRRLIVAAGDLDDDDVRWGTASAVHRQP